MPSAGEITRHHEPDPDDDPWKRRAGGSSSGNRRGTNTVAWSAGTGRPVMDYTARKQDTIREIYDRAFRAAGLLP